MIVAMTLELPHLEDSLSGVRVNGSPMTHLRHVEYVQDAG
jgi:hypothetical protein